MKASIVIELLSKGLDKARDTEKALKNISAAADKGERDALGLAKAETAAAAATGKLAAGSEKAATAVRKGGDAMRRTTVETRSLEREASGLARAETRLADAGSRVAAGHDRTTSSLDRSTDAMRRARSEAQAFERQQDSLGRKANRTATPKAGEPHAPASGGFPGVGGMGGFGMALAGGFGMGVGGAAGVGMIAKAAIDHGREVEFARDQLQVLGEYSDEQAKLYDKILKPAGIRRGVGSVGAYGVFGGLMAGGLDAGNAAKMTDDVMMFAKASITVAYFSKF